jgi:hypothetical protein
MSARDDLDDLLGEIEDAFKGGATRLDSSFVRGPFFRCEQHCCLVGECSRATTNSAAVPRTSTTSSAPLKSFDDYRATKSLQVPTGHHERLPPTSSFHDARPYASSYGDTGKTSSVSGSSKSGAAASSTSGGKSWLDDLLADTDEVSDVKKLEVKPAATYSSSSSASGPPRAASLSGSKLR